MNKAGCLSEMYPNDCCLKTVSFVRVSSVSWLVLAFCFSWSKREKCEMLPYWEKAQQGGCSLEETSCWQSWLKASIFTYSAPCLVHTNPFLSRLQIHALALGNAQIKVIHTRSVHPIQSLDSMVVHSFPAPHNLCCAPASAPGHDGWCSPTEKLCSTFLPLCCSCAVPHLIYHPPLQEESHISSWALLQYLQSGVSCFTGV